MYKKYEYNVSPSYSMRELHCIYMCRAYLYVGMFNLQTCSLTNVSSFHTAWAHA